MEKDTVIRNFELSLLDAFSPEQIENICGRLRVQLLPYDITLKETHLIPYDNTNQEILIKWASCMLLEGKSKNTIRQYMRELNKVVDFFGNKHLCDITSDEIKAYMAYKLQSGCKKVSVTNCRNYIASFFKWAYLEEEQGFTKDICAKVKAPKLDKIIKDPFEDVEIDKMRNANLSLRDRAMFEVLISSGVRVNELINLNKGDIDLDNLKVHVKLGKGGKDRITYISKIASHHLRKYLDSRTDTHEALFLSLPNRQAIYQNRITKDGVREILRQWGKKTGVRQVNPHKFRHTFATTMYNRGMELNEIQRLLGHSNISTTLGYIKTDDFRLEQSYLRHTV